MTTDSEHDEALAQAVRLRELRTPEAHERLLRLAADHPAHGGIAYQTAWSHDRLGLEAQAVPFYERALEGAGLPAGSRHGVFLGLGSTLRVLGRYEEAHAVLRRGLAEYPDDAALRTFLAMTLYNLGEAREAVSTLLKVAAATSADDRMREYVPAVEYYADHLDETE
ncbi:tetratricopeptide repeat protein [Streptomyces sp. NBC_01104]|uniref:tetratricopeptide repeat protein n=1 Tax=Streptomyces sp. NBC_01104 TaxID=2903750 RepID=UPI00386AD68C|nr:tetratricopeptide repeat protein [Streptomyces sp. NBC_01104]